MLGLNAGTAYVTIRPDMRGIHTGVQTGLRGVDRQFDSAGSLAGDKYQKSFGRRFLGGLGTIVKRGAITLGTVGVIGAAAIAKSSIKLEQEFSGTMNQIGAVAEVPKKQLKAMSALALKMGADTVFSANESSAAMLELAKGGMKPATIAAGGLKGTLTLAAAGGTDMATAAMIASDALNIFNLRGKDMKLVASALAGGANASSASIESLGLAMSQAGLSAKDAGLSVQETVAVLAAFDNAGIKGSDAGTSLKTMLSRLVPQTDKAKEAMKGYNLEFVNADGSMKSITQVSDQLQSRLGGLSQAERTTALNTIFGSDARRAATVLMNEGGKGIDRYVKKTSDLGAAQRVADSRMKGTAGAVEQMKGSLETAGLAIGIALRPATIGIANLVTDIANKAIPYIEKFGGWLKGYLKGDNIFKDIAGWVSRLLPQFDKVSDVAPSMMRGLAGTDTKKTSSGLAGIGGALADIGAGIASVDWASVREAFSKGMSDTVSVFSVAIGFLADHLDTLARWLPAIVAGFIAYKTAQALSNVVSLAAIPITVVQTGAQIALARSNRALAGQLAILNNVERVSMLQRIRGVAAMVAQRTATLAVAVATRTYAAGQWLLNAAMSANPLGLIVAALVALGAGLVLAYKKSETFRNIVNGAWSAIKKGALAVVNWFKGPFVDFFTKTIPNVFRSVIDWVKNNWDVILAIITGPIGLAVLVVRRNWDKITGFFSAAWQWVKDVFGKLWGGVKAILTQAVENARNNIKGLWDKITGAFSAAVDWVKNVWSKSYAKVKEWITGPIDAARTGVGRILDRVKGAFSAAVDGIAKIWNGLKAVAAVPVNFMIDTVYNKGIREFVNSALGKVGIDFRLPYALPLNWNRATAGASSGTATRGVQAAAGAVLPGFTPGRDVHRFVARNGMTLDLSGGEAVMVPEWTRLVGGPRQVAKINKAARLGRLQYARGGVFWPVPGRDTSTYPGHDGVDINRGSGWDDFGDPIRAAVAGLVSYVGSGRGYGTGIFTKGPYGELVYGHTSRQNVRQGQHVDAGQLLGKVGNTGNSSAPHLHFGFPGGTYEAAMSLLRGAVPAGAGAGGGGGMMGWLVERVVSWLADKGKGLLGKIPGQGSVFGKMATGVGRTAIDAITETITSRFGGGGGGVSGDATPVNANARLGRRLAAARGWGRFWPALNALVMGESGWRNTAQNPSSSAYGIGQFLDSTWGTVGGQKTSDSRLQIAYMLRYIAQRYLNPARAWAFKQAHNWYDNGGILPKGMSLARNDTGRNEHMAVFTTAQWRLLKQAITGMTLRGGARIGTDFLTDLLSRTPKDAEQLRKEFLRTRDAMRGFRTRTEQARARLEQISAQPRVVAAQARIRQIDRRLDDLDSRRSYTRQIARLREQGPKVPEREVRQAQRVVEKAREQLAEAANKKQRREARQAVEDAEKELRQAGRARDREATKAAKQQQMEIERLKERRAEVRKLSRERRQVQRSAPIERLERAEKRLNDRLEAQRKARERANKAAQAYRAAQEAALERARGITATGIGLGSMEAAGFKSSGGILSNLRRAVVTVKDWGVVVKGLIGAGLRGPILEEFINAGPSVDAVRTGRSLLAGGQIGEINALQDQLRRQAIRAGATAAATYTPAQRAAIRRAAPVGYQPGQFGGPQRVVTVQYAGMPADTVETIVHKTTERVKYELSRESL